MQNDLHKAFFDFIAGIDIRSVVCLNGSLPDRSFFEKAALPIYACDGALNTLIEMNVRPDCTLGDLDSISPKLLKEHAVIHLPDQNFSDFEKTLQYLDTRSLLPAIVCGINGGYIDHILHNIAIFARIKKESLFYDPPIVGQILQGKKKYCFKLAKDTKLSLFPIPFAKVSTSGLKWNLQNMSLQFPQNDSSFNRSHQDEVLIEVHEGMLLLTLYLQPVIDAGL